MTSLSQVDMPGVGQMDMARAAGTSAKQRAAIEAATQSGNREHIREAAESFETTFISQMVSHMFKNIGNGDGMFGGGSAEGVWKTHYLDEISKSITSRGGIGIASVIERELLQLQEVK